MKKQILSFVLVLIMTIGILPTTAFAIEIYTSGDWVYFIDGETVKINKYLGGDTEVVVPAVIDGYNITHIHTEALARNEALEKVIISDGIEYIGSGAFSGCTALTDVTIPSSVTHIIQAAFSGCSSLTQLEIPYGVEHVGWAAFCGSAIETIAFPESVTEIGANVFEDCTTLKTVSLPRSLGQIGNYAFRGCTGITQVNYAGNRIEYFNLSNTPECENVTYAIKQYSFNINDTVFAEIDEETGKLVITGSGVITETIPYYLNDLVTDIEISQGITALDNEAFRYFKELKTITLPGTVTYIGTDAFEYCEKLESVNFGGTLEQYNAIVIGDYNGYFTSADTYCNGVHIHYFDDDNDLTCNGCDYERIIENTTEFAGGFGTEQSPYLIETKYHLNNVRNYLDAHFKMIADVEFTDADFSQGGAFYNGGKGFEPIGTDENSAFTGSFDGNGFTVKNFYTNISSDISYVYAGLFGYNKGLIKNVGMVDGSVIASVSSSSCYAYVGGIVGHNNGVIERCYNTGEVSTSSLGSAYAGGIAGQNCRATITNCYNTGDISASTSHYAYVGGIAGYCYDNSKIVKCYNTCNFFAQTAFCEVYVGGIAGYNYQDIITNCYYADTIQRGVGSGINTATRCTLEQLKQQSTYSGFDFEYVWTMSGNDCYPFAELKNAKTVSDHYFDNDCDTNCNCGHTRVITHNYQPVFDSTSHFEKCTVCGNEINKEQHLFDNDCDTDCNCGYVRETTHNYQPIFDNTSHFEKCTVCGDQINVVAHDFDNACDKTCNSCDYVRVREHNYQLNYSDTNHWYKCSKCNDAININAHVYTNNCDTICDICSAQREIIHSFGEYVSNKNATETADGTKTRVCLVCEYSETVIDAGTKLPTIRNTTEIFVDVEQTWYTEYVNYAYTYGIFKGNPDGTFKPLANITRAEFVQVLANITGVDTSNKQIITKFSDVVAGDWFAPAVKWANDNGIVAGYGEQFKPTANITREQMCVMIVNYAKFKGITLKAVEPKEVFIDDSLISSWAKDAVYACQMADIVNGKGEGRFDPAGTGLRAEASVIFTKFHKAYLR